MKCKFTWFAFDSREKPFLANVADISLDETKLSWCQFEWKDKLINYQKCPNIFFQAHHTSGKISKFLDRSLKTSNNFQCTYLFRRDRSQIKAIHSREDEAHLNKSWQKVFPSIKHPARIYEWKSGFSSTFSLLFVSIWHVWARVGKAVNSDAEIPFVNRWWMTPQQQSETVNTLVIYGPFIIIQLFSEQEAKSSFDPKKPSLWS